MTQQLLPSRGVRIVVWVPVGEHLYTVPHRELFRVHRVRRGKIKFSGYFTQGEAAAVVRFVSTQPNWEVDDQRGRFSA